MTDDLRAKLEAAIDETTWTPLAMHAKRDALFVVDATLGLVPAAHAVALDRQAVVALWLESGLVRRPTTDERAAWDSEPEARRFRFVIVQPFVLVEPLADA